jgi:hypothetical protein
MTMVETPPRDRARLEKLLPPAGREVRTGYSPRTASLLADKRPELEQPVLWALKENA